MSVAEKIHAKVDSLHPDDQEALLSCIEFFESKTMLRDERELKEFSIEQAMRGLEDEPDLYHASDIVESIK